MTRTTVVINLDRKWPFKQLALSYALDVYPLDRRIELIDVVPDNSQSELGEVLSPWPRSETEIAGVLDQLRRRANTERGGGPSQLGMVFCLNWADVVKIGRAYYDVTGEGHPDPQRSPEPAPSNGSSRIRAVPRRPARREAAAPAPAQVPTTDGITMDDLLEHLSHKNEPINSETRDFLNAVDRLDGVFESGRETWLSAFLAGPSGALGLCYIARFFEVLNTRYQDKMSVFVAGMASEEDSGSAYNRQKFFMMRSVADIVRSQENGQGKNTDTWQSIRPGPNSKTPQQFIVLDKLTFGPTLSEGLRQGVYRAFRDNNGIAEQTDRPRDAQAVFEDVVQELAEHEVSENEQSSADKRTKTGHRIQDLTEEAKSLNMDLERLVQLPGSQRRNLSDAPAVDAWLSNLTQVAGRYVTERFRPLKRDLKDRVKTSQDLDAAIKLARKNLRQGVEAQWHDDAGAFEETMRDKADGFIRRAWAERQKAIDLSAEDTSAASAPKMADRLKALDQWQAVHDAAETLQNALHSATRFWKLLMTWLTLFFALPVLLLALAMTLSTLSTSAGNTSPSFRQVLAGLPPTTDLTDQVALRWSYGLSIWLVPLVLGTAAMLVGYFINKRDMKLGKDGLRTAAIQFKNRLEETAQTFERARVYSLAAGHFKMIADAVEPMVRLRYNPQDYKSLVQTEPDDATADALMAATFKPRFFDGKDSRVFGEERFRVALASSLSAANLELGPLNVEDVGARLGLDQNPLTSSFSQAEVALRARGYTREEAEKEPKG